MSSADRLSKLMDAWLTSLELHLQYTQLSDLAYSCVQPWPQHDRPTRLVVQIAREKVLQLKQHCDARRAAGDEQFAEALESMLTLANLVGLQHIQRFIPLADPARARPLPVEAPAGPPDLEQLLRTDEQPGDPATIESTRELPQLRVPAAAAKPRPAARRASPAPRTAGIAAATAGTTAPSSATNAPVSAIKIATGNATARAAAAQASAHPMVAGGQKPRATPASAAVPIITDFVASAPEPAHPVTKAKVATPSNSAAANVARQSPGGGQVAANAVRSSAIAGTPTDNTPAASASARRPSVAGSTVAAVQPASPSAAHTRPASSATLAATDVPRSASDTQEMPAPVRRPAVAAPSPAGTADATDADADALTPAERIVIADATRLLKWGRPWHELAELVSRIADRPGITQVRRILRAHRETIEASASVD